MPGRAQIGRRRIGFRPGLGSGAALLALAALVLACAPAPSAAPGTQAPEPTVVPASSGESPAIEPTQPGQAGEIVVTLGLYSGRADPTWTLGPAEAAAVTSALAGLPEWIGAAPEGGLGYHGFIIEQDGRRLAVYLGVITSDAGGPQVLLADRDRMVERLLLELGRSRLAAGEIAEVERSLAVQLP